MQSPHPRSPGSLWPLLVLTPYLACRRVPDPEQEPALPAEEQTVPRYDAEYPAIGYATTALVDRVSRTDLRLEPSGPRGPLDSLLAALDIDVSSQVLVFSRTSRQIEGIRSQTPRAIYFNDDTYVAWVQGGNIEIASMDPKVGPVFYTIDRDSEPVPHRHLRRCLECHDTYALSGGGVPRFLTGSDYVSSSGDLISHEGWFLTSQRTPLRNRWGGWYVTGLHGDQTHLGNIHFEDVAELQDLDEARLGNLEDLDSLLDTSPYPSNKSDIVALLVLDHQVTVQNALTRCSYETRMELYRAEQESRSPSQEKIAALAEPLLEALFLVGAPPLSLITGTSGFTEHFESRGPRDEQGRSLRDLDLQSCLFRYPLSYLVYSPAYDALPEETRRHLHHRIATILRGEDGSDTFSHLSPQDRTAILEILADTKPELATPVR